MHAAEPAIVTQDLSKSYPGVQAVRGVSFTVAQGETFGFLGLNGAGKSTTIAMLCTLTAPTGGRAWVAGFDVAAAPAEVRRRIGVVFQDTTLDSDLTASENLRFHAELYGVPKVVLASRLDQVLTLVGLVDRRRSLVRTFSGGMKRRLEIARGLLHSPQVLFLDEPTIGLDPQTRRQVWAYLHQVQRREAITMFLTTHYLEETEHCDRIAIIDDGRIVVEETPRALKATLSKDRIELRTEDDDAAFTALSDRFGLQPTLTEGSVIAYVTDGAGFVPRLCAGLGVPILAVSVTTPTLDDVFLHYTGRTVLNVEASAGERLRSNPLLRARK
ncbi:MAG: ATP-binding cassette domain-containing protein [Egibacteraceae bacterium]